MSDTPPAAASAGASPSGEGLKLTFDQTATARSIFWITISNALLNIVTLTLWRFWGRTRIRRHLWAHTSISGQPLEYTGKGWELFKSFLFIIVVFIIPLYVVIFGAVFLVQPGNAAASLIFGVFFIFLYLFLFWLLGLAIYITHRYRLSRTTWRGVRFGLPGSGKSYGWAFLGYLLLTLITLGWFAPAMEMRLARRFWGEAVYGDKPVVFETPDGKGPSGGLYGPFALAWFGGILGYVVGFLVGIAVGAALGVDITNDPTPSTEFIIALYAGVFAYAAVAIMLSLVYYAALYRRIASCLTLGGVRFRHNATALSLLWLFFGNLLILVLTLGLGLPFAQVRTMRYIFRRLEADGELDTSTINQNPDAGPPMGEGLADAFDLGTI